MKILLTGASGFFGQSVVDALKHLDHSIEVICVTHSKSLNLKDDRFCNVKCNLHDDQQTKALIKKTKPTHLIHLAWHVPPQKFWDAKENFDWLASSVKLFQLFCEEGGNVFIGAGSLAEYDWIDGILDEENTTLQPNSIYGLCKKNLHELIMNLKRMHYPEVKILWPRIGYFFGENEPQGKLISLIIRKILKQEDLSLLPKATARAYTHVRHLGNVISKTLFYNHEDLVFNLNGSNYYTLEELVNLVANNYNLPNDKVFYGGYQSSIFEPELLKVNTDRMQSLGLKIPDTLLDDLKGMMDASYFRS